MTSSAHLKIGKYEHGPKVPGLVTLIERYLNHMKIYTALLVTLNILFMGQIRDLVNDRYWWGYDQY